MSARLPLLAVSSVLSLFAFAAFAACTASTDAPQPAPVTAAPTTTRPPLSDAIASLELETSAHPEDDLAQLLQDRSFAPDGASAACMSERLLGSGVAALVEAGRVLDGGFLFRPDGSVRSTDARDAVQAVYACTPSQLELILTARGVQTRSAACSAALVADDGRATEAMALYVSSATGPYQAEARRVAARLAGGAGSAADDDRAPARLLADRLGTCLSAADRTVLVDPP